MSEASRIVTSPEYEALHAFDAEHGTEPTRTIAERIVAGFFYEPAALVDKIQQAIEDARELGAKRGPLEDAAKRVKHG